jgi:hypothetical protein
MRVFIVRNVQRHILISTAGKTLTLENVYERFVLEVKSRNIPDYSFMQHFENSFVKWV